MCAEHSTLRIGAVVQPFLLLLLSFILLDSTLTAQVVWSSFNAGLYGASIRSFGRDDQGTFLAATNGGIYRRDADLNKWNLIRGGGDAGGIAGFRNGLFLCGIDNAVYLSDDGGSSWRMVDTAIHARTFGSASSGTLFVSGSHDPSVLSPMIARRSTDLGSTWTPVTIVPDISGDVRFAQGRNGHVLAATLDGIFISRDDGATWNATSFASPAYDLVGRDTSLYAATSEGVVVTGDDGASWSVVDTLHARELLFDGGTIFAVVDAGPEGGLYRTGRFGDRWSRLTSVVPRSIALDRDDNLWISVGTLPLHSSDQGESWIAGEVGMTSTDIGAMLAVDDNLFAIVRSALYRFTSADGKWTLLEQAPMVSRMTSWITTGTGDTRILAIGREAGPLPPFDTRDILYLTLDDGNTWSQRWQGGILTRPAINGPSFGVIGYGWPTGSSTRGGGLLVTLDAGSTWDSIPLPHAATSIAVNNNRILVGSVETDDSKPVHLGLLQSPDSGRTWETISDSIGVREMEWSAPDIALAITTTALARGSDTTLSKDGLALVDEGRLTPILVDTIPTSFLFVRPGIAMMDAILPEGRTVTLRSTDNGLNWSAVAIDDVAEGRLRVVIGSVGTGLLGIAQGRPCYSVDNGATWFSDAVGLPRANAQAISRRSSGFVVVGTGGDGVFIAADPLDVTGYSDHSVPPVRLRIVGGMIEISSDLPRLISIDMIDLLGRQSESIIERLMVDRTIRIPLPVGAHARGYYLFRARWGEGSTVATGIPD